MDDRNQKEIIKKKIKERKKLFILLHIPSSWVNVLENWLPGNPRSGWKAKKKEWRAKVSVNNGQLNVWTQIKLLLFLVIMRTIFQSSNEWYKCNLGNAWSRRLECTQLQYSGCDGTCYKFGRHVKRGWHKAHIVKAMRTLATYLHSKVSTHIRYKVI